MSEAQQRIAKIEESNREMENDPTYIEWKKRFPKEEKEPSSYTEEAWLEKFGKIIPANWNIWYNVSRTFEHADKQLSDELINAAITHPNALIIDDVASTQKLSVIQIKVIFSRKDVPVWRKEIVIDQQAELGMTLKELAEVTGKPISKLLDATQI